MRNLTIVITATDGSVFDNIQDATKRQENLDIKFIEDSLFDVLHDLGDVDFAQMATDIFYDYFYE